MRKGLLPLIAIGVCALIQVGAQAQSFNSIPETAVNSESASSSIPANSQPLTVTDLRAKLDEAKDKLKSQANLNGGNTVELAGLNRQTSQIDLVAMPKDSFLTKGLAFSTTSHAGRALTITVVRANGVNTAVRVSEPANGIEWTPLTVAFPIVKSGSITEVAY